MRGAGQLLVVDAEREAQGLEQVFVSEPVEHSTEPCKLVLVETAGDGLLRVPGDVGAGIRGCSPSSPHFRAILSMAHRNSKTRLVASGLSVLYAPSNTLYDEPSRTTPKRASSTVSSLSLPNAGSRRPRR